MHTIESLVDAFECHRLSRRELVASLTALVAGAASSSSAAQSPAPLTQVAQGRTLNHASLAVSDVASAADFYSKVLGLKVVSRPGNGGINLGLGAGFLGVYKLNNPGTVNHICIGVDDYDPERIAAKLKDLGVASDYVERRPRDRVDFQSTNSRSIAARWAAPRSRPCRRHTLQMPFEFSRSRSLMSETVRLDK
jgi:catechol 2,3-dioxygenase-like lactoylglutathione lyase family enzyme